MGKDHRPLGHEILHEILRDHLSKQQIQPHLSEHMHNRHSNSSFLEIEPVQDHLWLQQSIDKICENFFPLPDAVIHDIFPKDS